MTPRWPGWTKRAGGARPEGRADPIHRPHDHLAAVVLQGREFFTRKVKGDAQAKLYTRIDGKEVLLFDPMKIDPSGKSALWPRLLARRQHSRGRSATRW